MNISSAILVSLIGLAVAGVGLFGAIAPTHLTRLLGSWRVVIGFPVTLALRIGSGSIFLFAASDCRLPTLVQVVGWLELAGAVVLMVLGAGRLERFGDWWLQKPASFVRCWCLGALVFGITLMSGGEPF
jgi:hypothetical protein